MQTRKNQGLFGKGLNYEINGKFFKVIYNMYQNIKSCIKHNGSISPNFISEVGVRQGENLSPVLFSLYLNDLQDSNMESNGSAAVELKDPGDLTVWLKLLILLYAEDTVIFSTNQHDLQNNLNIFNDYCKNWLLNIKVNKTKVVVFLS